VERWSEVEQVDVVERLIEAIDAWAAEDLHGLFAPQLNARLGALVGASNRLAAELTRTVRECDSMGAEDDGLKTTASWLRGHARYAPAAAAQLVSAGRALEHLPTCAAGFAAGAITLAQVTVIAAAVRPEELARAADQGIDLSVIDAALATVASERPHDELVAVVRHYREALDPDGGEPDPTEGRRLSFTAHADGTVGIRGQLDAVGGEKLRAALEAITQAARPHGDTRTRAQQQADALVQLADTALAAGSLPVLRTVKPHVVVSVRLEDLLGGDGTPGAARTGFGQVLSAAQARWLACDASLTRIVLDPDGLPLDVGRTQRLVPPHVRRAVEQRDQHCVFAGCYAPTYWCDVHHLVEWINGGPTSLDNSGLVCERHHTKVHHGFRIERDPGGRWHTYRPDGTEIHILEPLATPDLRAA
jgi:Domain of unknown function (DUF222)